MMRCSPTALSVSDWVVVLQLLTSQQLSCNAAVSNGSAIDSTMQQFESELQYGCSGDSGRVMGSSTESSSSAVM